MLDILALRQDRLKMSESKKWENKRQGEGHCLFFISLADGKGWRSVREGKLDKASIGFAWFCLRCLCWPIWLFNVGQKGTLKQEVFYHYWNKNFSPSVPFFLFFATLVKWLIQPVFMLLAEAPIPRAATPFQSNDGPLTPHGLHTLP